MIKYEYKFINIEKPEVNEMEDILNEFGDQGWELVKYESRSLSTELLIKRKKE